MIRMEVAWGMFLDQSKRTVYSSSTVRNVLRRSVGVSAAENVMSLLERVVGPEPETLYATQCWLNHTVLQPRYDTASSLALLTASGVVYGLRSSSHPTGSDGLGCKARLGSPASRGVRECGARSARQFVCRCRQSLLRANSLHSRERFSA